MALLGNSGCNTRSETLFFFFFFSKKKKRMLSVEAIFQIKTFPSSKFIPLINVFAARN